MMTDSDLALRLTQRLTETLPASAALARLAAPIADAAEQARLVTDAEIGASTPALAIASSLHETQYTRLYRS